MQSFLTNLELSIVYNWETYKERKQPTFVFVNEMPNLVLIHQSVLGSGGNGLLIGVSLQKVIESGHLSPFLMERFVKDILSITSEELIDELQSFKSYLNSQQIITDWKPYSNLRGNSTVLKYRIGADYIDVVFETCPTHFYHYNYKLTTILITEELKRLAKSGAYLGEHTRKMKQGMFIKCPLQNS